MKPNSYESFKRNGPSKNLTDKLNIEFAKGIDPKLLYRMYLTMSKRRDLFPECILKYRLCSLSLVLFEFKIIFRKCE